MIELISVRRLTNLSVAFWYLASFLLALGIPLMSAGALDEIEYSGTSVNGLVENIIPLPGISISSAELTVPVNLSIDDGILSMTTTTGLSFNGDSSGRSLSFTGSVAHINAALATLQYRTLDQGEKTLNATIADAGEVYFPGNGHLYEVVNNGDGITWNDAKLAAEARTLNGAAGYLATVTTQAENDYLVGRLSGDGWFGASDAETEGDWKWVTGPEAGTLFWQGASAGVAVNSLFSNWSGGEPNDYESGEDCAQFYSDGSGWNDLHCVENMLSYYVVEYGAPGDLPTAPPSVSFTVNVGLPTADIIPISSCLDLIELDNNPELENRYDTLQLTNDIDCNGESLQAMYDEGDFDFGNIGFRGTFDGNGYTLSNIDINNSGSDDMGLFAYSDDASFIDLTVTGSVVGSYCVGGLVGEATNTNFTNVTSSIAVEGYGEVGGLVGCYEAEDSKTNTISTVTVTNSLTNTDSDATGGLIGDFEAHDTSTTLFETLSADTIFTTTNSRLGGIIGEYDAYDNSVVEFNDITVDTIDAEASTIGGVIGEVDSEDNAMLIIEDVTITGYLSGLSEIGGVIGELDGSEEGESDSANSVIKNTHIDAPISGESSVAGLVGEGDTMRIENSSYQGDLTSDDDYLGGLIGQADYAEVYRSWTTGALISNSGDYLGGILGESYNSSIDQSYSTMSSDYGSTTYVGGLVGYMESESTIQNSYARGNLSAGGSVGGLVGYCEDSSLTNTYATGQANAEGNMGGLIGDGSSCTSVNSFWDTETSTQDMSFSDETGKTTSEMKLRATFTNTITVGLDSAWNFVDIWAITETVNDGYPCLQWQNESCVADDGDGIPSTTEDAAPNSGDANNDGTADSDQPYVSSFVNAITGEYAVVELDSACSLTTASSETESAQAVPDSGYNYSSGFIRFAADCGTPGYSTTVQIIKYGVSAEGLVLRKHNPNTNAYFTILNAVITTATIGGQNAVIASYEIVDGGSLDIDGTVNGTVVDPVGLASQSVGVPNTGLGGRKQ